MDNKFWLQKALSFFNIGAWYGWKKDWTGEKRMSYENLILNDDTATMPTEAQVNAKIQELKDAEAERENKKTSGKQKLKDLGLEDDEIQSLLGV